MTTQAHRIRPVKNDHALVEVRTEGDLDLLAQEIDDLEVAHRCLRQLRETGALLGGGLEIEEALGEMEEATLGIFDADEVWLLRLEHETERLAGLCAFSTHNEGHAQLPTFFGCEGPDGVMSLAACQLLGGVVRGGEPLFIDSIDDLEQSELDSLFDGVAPDLNGFHSLAVVPLLTRNGPVGLSVSASVLPRRFTSERKSPILIFAGQLAQALDSARLCEKVTELEAVDSLSGLYNRRRTLEQLDIEVARARRYQGAFSVLLADIDNFRNFNNTYGHYAGDGVIKRVAGVLQRRNRSSDFVGRFEGGRFLLVLPATDRAGAATVADYVRIALRSAPFMAPNGSPIPLRLNFGVASFPADGHDLAALLRAVATDLEDSKRWSGDAVPLRKDWITGNIIDAAGFETLNSLVTAVDNKDHYTVEHSVHVAEQVSAIATVLELCDETAGRLHVAACLHDVGKIGIPDHILRKPGRLTPEEEDTVRQHSLDGSQLIATYLPHDDIIRAAVLSHHERWDGKGYPAQLAGDKIPLLARILAVADAYSAMITERPYRTGLTTREAVDEIAKGIDRQFDPQMVEAFLVGFANR